MPPLARNEIDTKGRDILQAWIDSLAGAPPLLQITDLTNSVRLTWTVGTNTFYVEQSPTLGPDAAWAPGGTPQINGNEAILDAPAGNAVQYYRLNSQKQLP
jgi:hypothetical protein